MSASGVLWGRGPWDGSVLGGEAMVTYRQEESIRLAREMPPKEMTMTLDETFTGGLYLVGMEPASNYIVLEHTVPARDQDIWQALLEPALASLNCKVIQATSDEAPGLLARVCRTPPRGTSLAGPLPCAA